MAQIQDNTKKQRPRTRSATNFFLGCFGFSESSYKVKENNTEKIRSSGRVKLGTSWLSSSRKSGDKKAAGEKVDQGRKGGFRMVRLSKKFSTTQLAQKKVSSNDGSAPPPSQIPAVVGGDEAVHGKANKEKREEKSQKKISLENGNSLSHSGSITKEASTHKKGIFRRNSWSQPTTPPPPEEDKNEVRERSTAVLSHSSSMLPAPAAESGGPKGEYSEEGHKGNERWAGKFDQLVGMSIIVVTLLTVIILGKFCAILCTSAWLYFYPIIRARKIDPQPRNGTKTKSLDLDIESQKHKKKVVFEGFLERNHRIN